MKKIVLATIVVTGLMAADSGMYIGLDYGKAYNATTQDSYSGDNDYSDIKFKIGYGADGGLKGQVTISSVKFDEAVFDAKNKQLFEIGYDVIKEFEVTKNFYPFLKAGISGGSMNVEGYEKSSIFEMSINIGAGISYKVVDHLYLLAGVDYIGRKWQDVQYSTYYPTGRYTGYYTKTTVSTTESGVKPYVGVNYRF